MGPRTWAELTTSKRSGVWSWQWDHLTRQKNEMTSECLAFSIVVFLVNICCLANKSCHDFCCQRLKRLMIWLPMLDINLIAFFDGDSSCHEMAQQWSLSMWTRSVAKRNDILFRLGLPLAIYHRVVNCYKHHKPIFDRYMMDEYTQKKTDESWWIIKFILR